MADFDIIEVIVEPPIAVIEVEVEAPVEIVEVVVPGLQGPAGPPGPSGGGSVYQHAQPSPASTWTIAHNLGRFPIITLYTTGGVRMEAGLVNLSANVCQVEFDGAYAGTAILI